jgi:hypothetical protein
MYVGAGIACRAGKIAANLHMLVLNQALVVAGRQIPWILVVFAKSLE